MLCPGDVHSYGTSVSLSGSAVQQCASVGHRTGRSSNSWISSELLRTAAQYESSLLGYLWQGTRISILLQQLQCNRCHSKGSLFQYHFLRRGLEGHKPVRKKTFEVHLSHQLTVHLIFCITVTQICQLKRVHLMSATSGEIISKRKIVLLLQWASKWEK